MYEPLPDDSLSRWRVERHVIQRLSSAALTPLLWCTASADDVAGEVDEAVATIGHQSWPESWDFCDARHSYSNPSRVNYIPSTMGGRMSITWTRDQLCNDAAAKQPAETPDAALIQSIAAGENRAMQVFYARHTVRVYRFLLRLVGDVSTWLLAIARYKALSARRRRTDAELDEKIEGTIADPADDPEVVLDKKNRGELLRQALANLSPEHSEVIDLVYYHQKSVDEIAWIVGVPSATVKTRMFYARKKLAELIHIA
jgi:RNA polymerase sigma-70 factor (ECF subfamily)